jgi:hypothetical protein
VAEVGGKKSMHGGNKKCIQNFFRKHNWKASPQRQKNKWKYDKLLKWVLWK